MAWGRSIVVIGGVCLALGCQSVTPGAARRAEAYRNLGAMHLQRGKTGAATREFARALKANPEDAEAHFGIGEAYRRKGDLGLAEKHFKLALRHDPELLDARLNLGVLYLEQERWSDAIRENASLAQNPLFLLPERALVNLAWAEFRSGDAEDAIEHLREAIELNHRNAQAHLNLGIVMYEQGEFVEAATAFEKTIEIVADRTPEAFSDLEAQAQFRLAQTYLKLGQRARALEHLGVASERGGTGEWGRRSRDYMRVVE